jgi:hypothetical protein
MTKDHILCEIGRAAAQNSGKAIGWRRFESDTGIGISDWMKFWARWGDAVREAGFAPMTFNAAFDDTTLLERYAKLTREIGRLPAWSDLKLKANTDASFPSEKVFRRLKSKEERKGHASQPPFGPAFVLRSRQLLQSRPAPALVAH